MLPDTAAHPWAARYALRGGGTRGPSFDWVRPTVTFRYNTAYPYGMNDGAVWAGRGLTTAAQLGVAVRWGALSATIAPTVFRAENATFTLADNGQTGDLRFGDLRFPGAIDLPRRFGDAAYTRVDPGQSTVRVDAGGVVVGASTANEVWGPGDRFPMVMSNNAPGIPRVFAGTSRPLDLRILTLHLRAEYGRLDQSEWSPVRGSDEYQSLAEPGRLRFYSGLVAVIAPRGVPGLELGGSRVFQSPWRAGGPTGRDFRKLFEAFYKEDVVGDSGTFDSRTDLDNQIASAFFRWAVANSGFELFGEYYREDHNFNVRDLVLEPDHSSGYLVGVRKAFRRADGSVVGLRAEMANAELSTIGQRRPEGLIYLGSYLPQGHTQRGQLIGANIGVGSGSGASLGVDWYTRRGRWSASYTRVLRGDDLARLGDGAVAPATEFVPRAYDVEHALGAEAVFFRGPADLVGGLTGVFDLDREFRRDAFNLNASLGVRYNLR